MTQQQAVRVHVRDSESWELDYAPVYGGWRITCLPVQQPQEQTP